MQRLHLKYSQNYICASSKFKLAVLIKDKTSNSVISKKNYLQFLAQFKRLVWVFWAMFFFLMKEIKLVLNYVLKQFFLNLQIMTENKIKFL